MYNVLKLLFSLQCILGSFDVLIEKPEFGLPYNTGWIIITGLSTIIVNENKR